MSPDPDDVCIRRYLKGDISAFDELYAKYRTRVYGYLLKSTNDRDVANDLYQDVWIKVIAGFSRYDSKGRFRQWIITCAHNIIIDHYRRQKPMEPLLDDDRAVRDPTNPELAMRIDQAVRALPFEQRQTFHLREYLACSLIEIAEIQDCSVEAAKSRLRYAYKKLREELKDYNHET